MILMIPRLDSGIFLLSNSRADSQLNGNEAQSVSQARPEVKRMAGRKKGRGFRAVRLRMQGLCQK
jgi:hypothetical protein